MNGKFSGNPKAEWLQDAESRSMRLLEDFFYIDPQGRQWLAPSGSVVDGASIPSALWSTVGSPYIGNYRNASIVHDVACDTLGVEREDADEMFYYACLAGGCSVTQAKLLYAGVRIGAWTPKVRFWSTDILLSGATTESLRTRRTVSDRSFETTFDEIALDLLALSDDSPFLEVRNVVESHLRAKAAQ